MSHKKAPSISKESPSESSSVEVRVVDVSESGLDSEVGLVGEQVSEIATENASEQAKGTKTSAQNTKENPKKLDASLDDRLLLRERLLEAAPKELTMRREVEAVLQSKKVRLEGDIRQLSRRKDYEPLSRAIAELRVLVHQIELVAHASYELLKDIWLRVIHKFA